jgi:hypothetical protein
MRFTTPHKLRIWKPEPHSKTALLQERVTSPTGQVRWQTLPIYVESRKNYVKPHSEEVHADTQ